MKLFFLLILSGLLSVACASVKLPKVKATFKFTNQNGEPVANLPISFGLSRTTGIRGETDADGVFVGEGPAHDTYLLIAASFKNSELNKKYYRFQYEKRIADWKNYPKDGKWKPWNETHNFIIKEKINPIPMYAINPANFKSNIPIIDKWIGYDLELNDWLAPFGSGVMADFECCLSLTYCKEEFLTQSLKIRFPYSEAGCYFMKKDLGHAFPSTYHANEKHDYDREIAFSKVYLFSHEQFRFSSNDSHLLEKDDYIVFRTRTKVDDDGNLIEARYGKIYGPINFNFLLKPTGEIIHKSVQMSYHLNPNINDTNLECNRKSLIEGVQFVSP